jgi:hypothetical protein
MNTTQQVAYFDGAINLQQNACLYGVVGTENYLAAGKRI